MKMMIRIYRIMMIACLVGTLASAAYAGADPAAFLKVGVGARAMAMGGAFVSVADDTSAIYWNPAGLGKVTRVSAAAMVQSLSSSQWDTIKDVTPTYQFVGLTFPVRSFSIPGINNTSNTFGIGMISNSLASVPYTTLDTATNKITRDTFEDTEKAYFVSYGFPLFSGSDNIYTGFTMKYITQQFTKIDGANASGIDMDFGCLMSLGTLNLGLVFQRGVDLRWDNGHTDSAGMTSKAGLSNTFHFKRNLSLLASVDVVQAHNEPLSGNFGAEFGYRKASMPAGGAVFGFDALLLRLGLENYTLENRYDYASKLNSNMNYTAGLGLNMTCFGMALQLDYAMGTYRLGDKNRVSINLFF